jgi:hypothetical protein
MRLFVTVLDSVYLPQALSLHRSLERYATDWRLAIVCCDEYSYSILSEIALSSSEIVRVERILTDSHISVRASRSQVEFIWTLTPRAIQWGKETYPHASAVTYIDADLYPICEVDPFFGELNDSGKATLLTPHAFSPTLDFSSVTGKFCVQFQSFAEGLGSSLLAEWNAQCLRWCGSTPEPGRFGDQKYLDDWLQNHPEDVGTVTHPEWFLAPWNVERFPWSEAMFYHFHALRITGRTRVSLGNYRIPRAVMENVYGPYLLELRKSCDELRLIDRDEPWIRPATRYSSIMDYVRFVRAQVRAEGIVGKRVRDF